MRDASHLSSVSPRQARRVAGRAYSRLYCARTSTALQLKAPGFRLIRSTTECPCTLAFGSPALRQPSRRCFCADRSRMACSPNRSTSCSRQRSRHSWLEAPIRLGKTLGGVTRSRQAILELDGVSHFAVWKTIDDKRTGVTSLGRGASEINFRDTWKTEIPAYELDKLLGLNMVPAAVARTFRQHGGRADRVGRSRDVRSGSPEEAADTAEFRGLEPEHGECPAVRQPDLQHRPALE